MPDPQNHSSRDERRTPDETSARWSDQELHAWLDEQLALPAASDLEQEIRHSTQLRQRLAELISQRNQGEHSVGEIWRERRLSCPDRGVLRRFLLNLLDENLSDYIRFHIDVVGCRLCAANVEDLSQETATTPDDNVRRRRYFESSAGELPSSHRPDG